jgi:ABC-type antimicrobial peptide transport system permease subunit
VNKPPGDLKRTSGYTDGSSFGRKSTSQLSGFIALICVLVTFVAGFSCLGVYRLVAFMVVRKTKEVGIRKVLGASMGSILAFLLSLVIAWATIGLKAFRAALANPVSSLRSE